MAQGHFIPPVIQFKSTMLSHHELVKIASDATIWEYHCEGLGFSYERLDQCIKKINKELNQYLQHQHLL